MKDLLGKAIEPGDYIVYAISYSSSVALRVGKVLGIENKRLKVRAAENGWGNRRWSLLKKGKPVTIACTDRVTVIWPSMLDGDLYDLLQLETDGPAKSE